MGEYMTESIFSAFVGRQPAQQGGGANLGEGREWSLPRETEYEIQHNLA